jgi:hypothetical protein
MMRSFLRSVGLLLLLLAFTTVVASKDVDVKGVKDVAVKDKIDNRKDVKDRPAEKDKANPGPKEVAKGVKELTGHFGGVRGVAFSPDGKSLASCGADSSVRIWGAITGKQVHLCAPTHNHWTTSVSFSPDSKKLVSTSYDRSTRTWDRDKGSMLHNYLGHPNLSHSAAFSPDGKYLVSVAYEPNIRVLDAGTGRELRSFKGDDNGIIWAVAYSPDGKMIATAGQDRFVHLWDPQTGTELKKLSGHTEICVALAFSPDGRTLISAGHDKTIRLWEVSTGKERLKLEGHTNWIRGIAVSSDGRTIASGGYDNVIRLWDALTGKELKKLDGHKQTVWGVAFAPGDKTLASGSEDRTIRLWDVAETTARDKPKGEKLADKEVAAFWTALGNDDGVKAYKAIIGLAASPESSVPFLKENLKAVRALDEESQKKVNKLIEDLGNEDFAARKKAMDGLTTLGAPVGPDVRKALAGAKDVDLRLRLFVVLRSLEGASLTAAQLRTLRALETLERINNPDAKEVLEGLGKGVPDAWLTKEAKSCLARLNKKSVALKPKEEDSKPEPKDKPASKDK